MTFICEDSVCTGCSACLNVCPKEAITMLEDIYGFLHPSIENDKCIDCGLCKKVCPQNTKPLFVEAIKVYASVAKDENIHQKSTSGGIATALSYKIINEGGVVYGAAFDDDFNLIHQRIENIDDLQKLQGSKYVQSNISKTYRDVKTDLSFHKVLFVGTPCQIAGLINYIPTKLKSNLYTVSFICGGVPSVKFLKSNLTKYLGSTVKLRFRNGADYGFWLTQKNDSIIHICRDDSRYFRGFDKRITLRKSCYNCQYARNERIGDLTIGDFWGLKYGQFSTGITDGVSIIICSTEKGQTLINDSKSILNIEEHDLCEALEMNPRLSSFVQYTPNVDKFRSKFLETRDFDKSVDSVVGFLYTIYKIKGMLKKNPILNGIHSFITKR